MRGDATPGHWGVLSFLVEEGTRITKEIGVGIQLAQAPPIDY